MRPFPTGVGRMFAMITNFVKSKPCIKIEIGFIFFRFKSSIFCVYTILQTSGRFGLFTGSSYYRSRQSFMVLVILQLRIVLIWKKFHLQYIAIVVKKETQILKECIGNHCKRQLVLLRVDLCLSLIFEQR